MPICSGSANDHGAPHEGHRPTRHAAAPERRRGNWWSRRSVSADRGLTGGHDLTRWADRGNGDTVMGAGTDVEHLVVVGIGWSRRPLDAQPSAGFLQKQHVGLGAVDESGRGGQPRPTAIQVPGRNAQSIRSRARPGWSNRPPLDLRLAAEHDAPHLHVHTDTWTRSRGGRGSIPATLGHARGHREIGGASLTGVQVPVPERVPSG